MNVLIGCEFSGVVRNAFRELGHNAWSCDILPAEDNSPYHMQCDVRDVLHSSWDIGIFHPPCTYLCNSGVRWFFSEDKTKNKERWDNLQSAAKFFKLFLKLQYPHVIENPIMHKYARNLIGKVPYTQIIHPWQHGHGETKATCLWLHGLPPITPTNLVPERNHRVHLLPPGPNRGMERSRTYPGIATAFAKQWGSFPFSEQ